MTTIDDLDDAWADHLDREHDRYEDDYAEFCDEAGVDPLTSRAHLLYGWRNAEHGTANPVPVLALGLVAALFAIVAGGPARTVGAVVVVGAALALLIAPLVAWASGWWTPRQGVRR